MKKLFNVFVTLTVKAGGAIVARRIVEGIVNKGLDSDKNASEVQAVTIEKGVPVPTLPKGVD